MKITIQVFLNYGLLCEVERSIRARSPKTNRWWEVTYKGQKYQVFGGIYTPYRIQLTRPIPGKGK